MTAWESLCELEAGRFDGDEDAGPLDGARTLLHELAMEDPGDRIWTVSDRDADELRAVVYAAARERQRHRYVRTARLRAAGSLLFAQILIDSDDEEADPSLCRERYDEALERGESLISRVAQSGKFRIRILSSMSDDDLRCAALAAAVAEEGSWSL